MDIPKEFLTPPDPEGEFTLPIILVVYARPADHVQGEHIVTPLLHDLLAQIAEGGVIHEEWNYYYPKLV